MTADLFDQAIQTVLLHEGGFVKNPADPGGATHWGISLRFLRTQGLALGDVDGDGDIDEDDIRALTRDQAVALYRTAIWGRYGYDELPGVVAIKTFDLCVNAGPAQAHRILQRACHANGYVLKDDGVLGPKTRTAVDLLRDRWGAPVAPLMAAMRSEAAGFYRGLVAADAELSQFLAGWLNRAYS